MNESDESAVKPPVILGVAAHPDDLDFCCSGTIARLVREGAEAYYLILTDGSKGSEDRNLRPADLVRIRQEEQREAARAVGVKDVVFLDYEDGCLQVSLDVKREIARHIRRLRPDMVFCFDPTMVYVPSREFINHPDHRAAGQNTLDAIFPLARDHLSFPELLAEGLEPHKVRTVMLTNFEKANHYEDITGTIDLKMSALAAHPSQMSDLAGTQARMRELAARDGQAAGCDYAEAFMRLVID